MFSRAGAFVSAGRIFHASSSEIFAELEHSSAAFRSRRRQESATVIFPLQVRAAKIADPVAVVYPGIVLLNPLNRQALRSQRSAVIDLNFSL